ncbi:ATP-binding domain-containing protein, partial [Candidatus Uhrbacteria bacterium]|nr:ATP-binding domain-containing protein [Candidatus Uhrbacteria bacterium]
GRHTWEIFEYRVGTDGAMEEEVVGSYTQYPVMLAWAVTIHKAQGKTFDRVLVDVGHGAFAHGQMYVALSRCTTLEGIVLLREFRTRDIILDEAVAEFMGLGPIHS